MAETERRPVRIVETALCNVHQSSSVTKMPIEQILLIIDKMGKVGYHAVECQDGAIFDSRFRFLKGDPWERLRKLRDGFRDTKLQVLFRGQNILGYNHYADDVVEYFVQKPIPNGIDIVRVSDRLSGIRNLETTVEITSKEKGHVQAALCYTLGDTYTLDYWKDIARRTEGMSVGSLCIKDMAGLLTPYATAELVQALKGGANLPIDLHIHYTSGAASMTYLKTVKAGCEIIGCAMSPLALGTSQPTAEVIVETFRGTPYDTSYDQSLLVKAVNRFQPIREQALRGGLLDPEVLGVNIKTLQYRVPGGMFSSLVSQLKETGRENKYRKVLEGIPRVRKGFGESPLAAPLPQTVGAQAVMSIIMGKRYKMAPKESKETMLGEFGQTVKPFSPETQKKIIGGETPVTCRSADLIAPQFPQSERECAQWKQQDEDVLSYALFPAVVKDSLRYRAAQQIKVNSSAADEDSKAHPV